MSLVTRMSHCIYICLLIAGLVAVSASCSNRYANNIPTDEEIAIALAEQKTIREKEQEKESAIKAIEEKTNNVIIKKRVEEILISKPRDINQFVSENFYNTPEKGEFETSQEYIQRINSSVNPDQVYYFEITIAIGQYDADHQFYKLYTTDIVPFLTPLELQRTLGIDESGSSLLASVLLIVLQSDMNESEYVGVNAYGASTVVTKTRYSNKSLLAVYNSFKGMSSYKYELDLFIGDHSLIISVPVEEAKALDLKDQVMTAKIGVKFKYGIGSKARHIDYHAEKPTIDNPVEDISLFNMLAVDLDSFCIVYDEEVISCRLKT